MISVTRCNALAILSLSLLLPVPNAYGAGFSLNPWIIFLEPDKNKLSHELILTHDAGDNSDLGAGPRVQGPLVAQPVPVELKVVQREVDIEGMVRNNLDQISTDFVVFPSQIILYPGDIQKVQLQWVGTSLPLFETSYGLIAEQIPVGIPDAGGAPVRGGVNIMVRYEAIVVVTPKGATPAVVVDTAYALKGQNGSDSLFLLFSNPGTGRQSLGECHLALTPRDAAGKLVLRNNVKVSLTAEEFPILKQALFARGKRRLVIPWPKNLPIGQVAATLACPSAK